MILYLEPGGKKSIHRVACVALAGVSAIGLRQLSFVRVRVAGAAGPKIQAAKFGALAWKRPVTTLAGDIVMQPLEGKSGPVVHFRSPFRLLDLSPARGVVAARAGRAELTLVRIAMAIVAGLVRDALELHKASRARRRKLVRGTGLGLLRWMATGAFDSPVLTGERICGRVVVKSRRRLPSLLAMTSLTGIAQLPAVLVEVTTAAPSGEPQIRLAVRLLSEKGQNRFAVHQTLLVALAAFHLCVLSQERKAHFLMVEGLLRGSPFDQREVFALMLVVAALTSPLRNRSVTMKAGTVSELRLELSVASETFLHRHLLASGVTLGALAHPFETGVGLG